MGGIALVHPEILGVGYETITDMLQGNLGVGLLLTLLLLKLLATGVTIGSGGSGGIFAPSLFLGAATGGAVGVVAHELLPAVTASPGAYALVGMGAVAAGDHPRPAHRHPDHLRAHLGLQPDRAADDVAASSPPWSPPASSASRSTP